MPASWAFWMNVSAMAASAMLRPPDAEPVMPDRIVVVTASLMSGLGMDFRALAIARKPGKAAMTAPKPYSEAVFIVAKSEPAIADFEPSANFAATGFHAKRKTLRMPTSKAPSTAQIAATLETSCTIGARLPAAARL